MQILKIGTLHYLRKIDKNVKEETYEPVSFENWKMLRDLEPGKFGLDYEEYCSLKKEQYNTEVERRKNCECEMIGYMYNLYPSEIEKTKKQIIEITSKDNFYNWLSEQEIVDKVLNY